MTRTNQKSVQAFRLLEIIKEWGPLSVEDACDFAYDASVTENQGTVSDLLDMLEFAGAIEVSVPDGRPAGRKFGSEYILTAVEPEPQEKIGLEAFRELEAMLAERTQQLLVQMNLNAELEDQLDEIGTTEWLPAPTIDAIGFDLTWEDFTGLVISAKSFLESGCDEITSVAGPQTIKINREFGVSIDVKIED